MTTLHDHIQMLRAELTSFHLSHGSADGSNEN
jgi:hypothetical protein